MASPRASAVIIAYNSAHEIDACLGALIPNSPGLLAEVIVVDNASVDDTCAVVTQYPGVRLIRNDKNKGFAAAVNRGMASTSSDYLLVLNPDVVVTAEALLALMEALRQSEQYAAVGCRMVYPNGSPQTSSRPFPTVTTFLGRAFFTNDVAARLCFWRKADNHRDVTTGLSSMVRQVDWILGGCMMIRRTAYSEIGPLDEAYFLYYEDIDWCYRAHLQGWKIGFLSNACVVHDYKRSSSRISFTNSLTWVHLASACRFFRKSAWTRGLRTIF